MVDPSAVELCIRDFLAGKYNSCASRTRSLVVLNTEVSLEVFQLRLISLQRLRREVELEEAAQEALAMTAERPWDRALVQLTLGQDEIASVIGQAATPNQRCQALYYAGARQLTLGNHSEARHLFAACLETGAQPILEQRLAEVEIRRTDVNNDDSGPPPEEVVKFLLGQANGALWCDDPHEAVTQAGRAMAFAREVGGPGHPLTAIALDGLGRVMLSLGEQDAALTCHEQALVVRLEAFGPEHPVTSISLNDVGFILMKLGRHHEALAYFAEALAVRRRLLGDAHIGTAVTLGNIGLLFRELGDRAAARWYLERNLAIRQALYGADHPEVAQLARTVAELGDAPPLTADPLEPPGSAGLVAWEVYGQGHPEAATRSLRLAKLLQVAGDGEGARHYLERAVNIRRKTLGPEHPQTAIVLNDLGFHLGASGQHAEARPYLEEALAIRRKLFGERHEATALSFHNLAWLLEAMDDYPAAMPYIEAELAALRSLRGDEHPDTAACLNTLGGTLSLLGEYADARRHLEEALVARLKTLGERDPQTVDTEYTLGGTLNQLGEYADARRHLEHALTFQREIPNNDEQVARTLVVLASSAEGLRDYASAWRCFEEALAISKRTLGEAHPRTVGILVALGVTLQHAQDYTHARAYLEQALAIEREGHGDGHPETIMCLVRLSDLFLDMGEYHEARQRLEAALSVARSALGEDDPLLATVLSTLGIVLRELGEHGTAWRYLERSLAIRRRAFGENHEDTAHSIYNLGFVLEDIGDFVGAYRCYQRALAIRRTVLRPQAEETMHSLNSLGVFLKRMRHYPEARQYYEEILSSLKQPFGGENPRTTAVINNFGAGVINNLGALLHAMGDFDQSRDYLECAVAVQRKHGERSPGLCAALHNLGCLLIDLGDYETARRHLEEAMALLRQGRGPRTLEEATILSSLASLEFRSGRYEEALSPLEEAAQVYDHLIGEVFSTGSERQRLSFAKRTLGVLSEYLTLVVRHFADRPATVRTAFDMVLRRKAITAEALAVQRDAVLKVRHPGLRATLDELASEKAETARMMLDGPGSADLDAFKQRLAELQGRKEALEARLARAIPELALDKSLQVADADTVASAIPPGAALVEFIRFRMTDFRLVRAGEEPDEDDLPSHYLAFVLLAGRPDRLRMVDLGDAASIDDAVSRLRAGITGQRDARHLGAEVACDAGKSADRAGVELRKSVFDPIRGSLGEGRRLILAPDGDLSRLPFEVLPCEDGPRLIDAWDLSYVAVGRDLIRLQRRAHREPGEALVAADPDFNLTAGPASLVAPAKAQTDPAGPVANEGPAPDGRPTPPRLRQALDRGNFRFMPLPGTRLEAELIATRLGIKAHTGGEVVKRLIRSCRSPWILHLATHGFFLEVPSAAGIGGAEPPDAGAWGTLGRLSNEHLKNPLLRSGVALAGANSWLDNLPLPEEAGNGLLTAEDVTGLDLLSTELVVLSACETGLGSEDFCEGVIGLRRSFALAGARTVVMSLWKVPDQQTQELMVDFYEHCLTGESCAKALRAAQLCLRQKYGDVWSWGGFICQGDPGPLARRDSWKSSILSNTEYRPD